MKSKPYVITTPKQTACSPYPIHLPYLASLKAARYIRRDSLRHAVESVSEFSKLSSVDSVSILNQKPTTNRLKTVKEKYVSNQDK